MNGTATPEKQAEARLVYSLVHLLHVGFRCRCAACAAFD